VTDFLFASPMIEPVTVDDVRRYLGQIDEGDLYIGTLIYLARCEVEQKVGRSLIHQRWQKVLDHWPAKPEVRLHSAPIDDVSVRIYPLGFDGWRPYVPAHIEGDAGVVTFSEHSYRPALRDFHAIEINYLAGYGPRPENVPEELRQAVLWRVAVHLGQGGDDVPEYPPAIEQAIQKHIRRRM